MLDSEINTPPTAIQTEITAEHPPYPNRPDVTWEKIEHYIPHQRNSLIARGITPPEPLPNPADEYARLLMLGSLDLIGPTKPAGYLPLRTLTGICGRDVEDTKQELERRGLKTLLLEDKPEAKIASGALYAYDKTALQKLLNENGSIIDRTGWPKDADAFLRRVASETATDKELFKLIAWAFDDPRPEYRRSDQ